MSRREDVSATGGTSGNGNTGSEPPPPSYDEAMNLPQTYPPQQLPYLAQQPSAPYPPQHPTQPSAPCNEELPYPSQPPVIYPPQQLPYPTHPNTPTGAPVVYPVAYANPGNPGYPYGNPVVPGNPNYPYGNPVVSGNTSYPPGTQVYSNTPLVMNNTGPLSASQTAMLHRKKKLILFSFFVIICVIVVIIILF